MRRERAPAFDLRSCALDDVRALCARHHGYGSASDVAVYAFGVYEDGRIVAAYAWQPPPPGAARAVCPECPDRVAARARARARVAVGQPGVHLRA